MPLQTVSYEEVRGRMKPGDVWFLGQGWLLRDHQVGHTGRRFACRHCVPTKAVGDADGDFFNQVIESNLGDGFIGVEIRMLSERVNYYDGAMWWLPLSDAIRKKLDVAKFLEFCLRHNRKPYDLPQAVASALDALDSLTSTGVLTHNREDFEKFFCSELAAAALEAGGALPSLNSAEVTPIDLCMFDIFHKDYFQFKGEPAQITGYSSVDPAGWGT